MDASLPVAQALAVKDGRIVEVGGTDEVLWLREDDYEVIDLAGRTVVPGFVDPHNHSSIGASGPLWAACRAARSVADLQQTLAAAASDTPAGAWVRGVGYDHHLIGAHPTRGDLDAAVPDRPALVMHFSHHQCVANSRALAEAGIARGTPDPPGGEIARDKSGEPTGLLFERALSRAETASREAWEARFTEVARAASRRYAALGITAIQDAAVTPAMARRYAEARAAGALAIEGDEGMVASGGWFERPDGAAPGALKIFVDGGYRCARRVIRGRAPRTGGLLLCPRGELAALPVAALPALRGVSRAFSSDYPCGSNAPLVGIAAAVTRTSRQGRVAAPEEAISVSAALEAYTLGAARAARIDAVAGSLEPGKRADLLVLSTNPLECPATDLASIQVLETWMKGVRSNPP